MVTHLTTKCLYRKVSCQYCSMSGEHYFIEGQHIGVCSMFPLSCPNKCGIGTVPRVEMDRHKEECLLEEVNCSNNSQGRLKGNILPVMSKMSAHVVK